MSTKLPAFQFYPGDWRKDVGVQSLDFEARGVWFEILCLMHESERRGVLILNGRAMPEEALARLLGISLDLLKQNLTKIATYGVSSVEPETGALMCRRMVRDENVRKVRAEAGKMGGNPVLLKQKSTTEVKQKATPSSSSSSSDTIGAGAPTRGIEHDIYEAYPRKQNRADAIKAILKVIKEQPLFASTLLDRTKAYAAAVALWSDEDRQYIPHAASWFNSQAYEDDPKEWARKAAKQAPSAPARDAYTEIPGWREMLRAEFPDATIPEHWMGLDFNTRNYLCRKAK